MKKHPHHDLIVAWAADTSRVVQVRWIGNEWMDDVTPCWFHSNEYRFKPEPKPDFVRYAKVDHGVYTSGSTLDRDDYYNLKLIFDGETGKLKNAEVISD